MQDSMPPGTNCAANATTERIGAANARTRTTRRWPRASRPRAPIASASGRINIQLTLVEVWRETNGRLRGPTNQMVAVSRQPSRSEGMERNGRAGAPDRSIDVSRQLALSTARGAWSAGERKRGGGRAQRAHTAPDKSTDVSRQPSLR